MWRKTRGKKLSGKLKVLYVLIVTKTMTSTRLAFQNFEQPFITHGIDVIEDPADANAVYIFAVNHPSNPEYYEREKPDTDATKARSQIELFHHALNDHSHTYPFDPASIDHYAQRYLR